MKLKKSLLALASLLITLPLASCAKMESGIHHDMSEYVLETEYKDDYRILQLTDLHLSNKDDRARQYKFLDETITRAHPDMIVFTGDNFTFGTKKVVKEFCDFVDSYNVPWTLTLGNHDEQCYFSVDWLTSYLNSYGSNCLFKDIQNDDVFGNANFAINLTKNGKPVEQVIIMDSNRYHYGLDYIGYDYFKENQIDWYQRLVNYTAAKNGNIIVNSVMFFHIPLPEFLDAWEESERGSSEAIYQGGVKGEGVSSPKVNTHFWNTILNNRSTDAILVGHDHVSDYCVQYKGIYLGYGVTSTDRIYFDEELLGGKVVVIHNDHSLDFENIVRSYDEYE